MRAEIWGPCEIPVRLLSSSTDWSTFGAQNPLIHFWKKVLNIIINYTALVIIELIQPVLHHIRVGRTSSTEGCVEVLRHGKSFNEGRSVFHIWSKMGFLPKVCAKCVNELLFYSPWVWTSVEPYECGGPSKARAVLFLSSKFATKAFHLWWTSAQLLRGKNAQVFQGETS